MSVIDIKINKQIPLHGKGDSLESRLRKVSLRGFEHVKIYKDAAFTLKRLTPAAIRSQLFVSQPHVFRDPTLHKVDQLARLFKQQGVDIFHLSRAYDYTARDEAGELTQWTMLPPIIERFRIPKHARGGFDYARLVGPELTRAMTQNGWQLDPALATMDYHNQTDMFSLVNDGSHRVHAGLERGNGITVLEVTGITPGFPFYSAPQHYSLVQVFPTRDEAEDLRVHIVTAPGQKQLYRLFPSGGIMSGAVRPAREGEVFV